MAGMMITDLALVLSAVCEKAGPVVRLFVCTEVTKENVAGQWVHGWVISGARLDVGTTVQFQTPA